MIGEDKLSSNKKISYIRFKADVWNDCKAKSLFLSNNLITNPEPGTTGNKDKVFISIIDKKCMRNIYPHKYSYSESDGYITLEDLTVGEFSKCYNLSIEMFNKHYVYTSINDDFKNIMLSILISSPSVECNYSGELIIFMKELEIGFKDEENDILKSEKEIENECKRFINNVYSKYSKTIIDNLLSDYKIGDEINYKKFYNSEQHVNLYIAAVPGTNIYNIMKAGANNFEYTTKIISNDGKDSLDAYVIKIDSYIESDIIKLHIYQVSFVVKFKDLFEKYIDHNDFMTFRSTILNIDTKYIRCYYTRYSILNTFRSLINLYGGFKYSALMEDCLSNDYVTKMKIDTKSLIYLDYGLLNKLYKITQPSEIYPNLYEKPKGFIILTDKYDSKQYIYRIYDIQFKDHIISFNIHNVLPVGRLKLSCIDFDFNISNGNSMNSILQIRFRLSYALFCITDNTPTVMNAPILEYNTPNLNGRIYPYPTETKEDNNLFYIKDNTGLLCNDKYLKETASRASLKDFYNMMDLDEENSKERIQDISSKFYKQLEEEGMTDMKQITENTYTINNDCSSLNTIILKSSEEDLTKARNDKAKKLVNLLRSFTKRIIFTKDMTKIIWVDGTSTEVHRQKGDKFDKEKGILLCIVKMLMGNTYHYYDLIKELLEKADNDEKEREAAKKLKEEKKAAKAKDKENKQKEE